MTGYDEDAPQPAASRLDTTRPHSARVWNYWLGGKDNFAADRQLGDQVRAVYPEIAAVARVSRGFLGRVVTFLAADAGVRQFLDIGTGLPTADNTHEVAQRVEPTCRIVYVDNDPLVLAHARALLTSSADGVCDYVDADVRDPDAILAAAARTLDFTRPVGLTMLNILGHIGDYDEARAVARRLMEGLACGSYLVVADSTDTSPGVVEAAHVWNMTANPPYHLRSPEQIAAFFDGLDLVEPGVVPAPRWRPDATTGEPPDEMDLYCGVALKP